MSSGSFVLRGRSFRAVPDNKPKLPFAKTIDDHKWLYGRSELQYICQEWQDPKVVVGRLAEVGGVKGLAYALRSDQKRGLYPDECDVPEEERFATRKAQYGINAFTTMPMTPFCTMVMAQLADPFLIILMVAAFVSIIIGTILSVNCPQNTPEWIDGIAILVAVALVVFVGAWNDYSQEKQFRKTSSEAAIKTTVVVRGRNKEDEGIEYEIDQRQVQVGDIVVLKTGSTIPCDGVYITGTDDFKVTEAALTGESLAMGKTFMNPLCLGGTQVVAGEGIMICIAVGDDTQWGLIMSRIKDEREETPLQENLNHMAELIGYGGMAAAALLFIVLLIKWGAETPGAMCKGLAKCADFIAEDKCNADVDCAWLLGQHSATAASKIPGYFILAVTIIVVAVPEGLPLAVTISLAYSMKRMMKDQNFVRHLAACETMSNATTICSDKTGTLTLNKMRVAKCSISNQYFDKVPGERGARKVYGDKINDEVLKKLTIGLAVNSKSFELEPKDKQEQEKYDKYGPTFVGGNSTEYALLYFAYWDLQCDYLAERKNGVIEKSYPFSSKIKRSSVLVNLGEGKYRMYLKGAAERVLALCNRMMRADGSVDEMTEKDKELTTDHMERMMNTGLRCLGMAWRDYTEDELERNPQGGVTELEFNDYIWLATAGIKDPVRPEVPDAVRKAQMAGVVVRMVTGDHLSTAKYIARECGIYTAKDHVCMEGKKFRNLTEAQKQDLLPRLRVMARSQPQDKENLVRWYKKNAKVKQVVAVTGDGANDALALKEANVGLAMGIQGTDVAKEAADIIILDDNFKSIVASVMWGRCVYDNIRKFLQFQLTVNVVAVTLSFLAGFLDTIQMDAILTPIQLLWVNLIMDTLAALALGTERPTEKLLERKPYKTDAGLISRTMIRFIVGHSIYQLIFLLLWVFLGWQWFHFDRAGNAEFYPDILDGDNYDCVINEGAEKQEECNYSQASCAYSSGLYYDDDAEYDASNLKALPEGKEGWDGNQLLMCRGSKHRHCSASTNAGKVCNGYTADGKDKCTGAGDGCTWELNTCKGTSAEYADYCRYVVGGKAEEMKTQSDGNDVAQSRADEFMAACNDNENCEWQGHGDTPLANECVYPTSCDHSVIPCVQAHKSMAFNIFVWCQIFNEINARKVNGEINTFEHFWSNPMYGGIVLITVVFQVLLIEVLGIAGPAQAVFKTSSASWDMWLVTLAIGAGSIIWNFGLNWIPIPGQHDDQMGAGIPGYWDKLFAKDLEALNVDVAEEKPTRRKDDGTNLLNGGVNGGGTD